MRKNGFEYQKYKGMIFKRIEYYRQKFKRSYPF